MRRGFDVCISYSSKNRDWVKSELVPKIEGIGYRAFVDYRDFDPGAPSFKETRSVLVKGFPFSIVYRVVQDRLIVVAIAPHRKRPHYWASRVD